MPKHATETYVNSQIAAIPSGGDVVTTVGPTSSGADYITDGTDDHVQINDAINALYALGGGTVRILKGTYIIANNIIVKKYVSLEGEGFNTRLKFGNAITLTEAGMIRVKDSTDRPTDVRISKLNLDGNKANNTTTGVKFYGVYTEADNVVVEDCWVHDFTGYGIDPHEAETTSTAGSRLIIRNNYVYSNGGIVAAEDYDGITLDMMHECVCTGNITYNNSRHGINIVTGSEKTVISSNVASGNGRCGITLTNNSSHVNLIGNVLFNNGREGLLAATGSQHLNITGNEIYSNGRNGIHLIGSSYNNIVGNKLRDNGKATHNTYSDIYLDDDSVIYSTYNLVTGNHSSSSETNKPKYGIEEKNASNNFNVYGTNSVTDGATGTVNILGANSSTTVANSNPTFNGMTIANATDVVLATGTGTKFGTASTQKIGFLGAAPAIQQTAATDIGSVLSTFGLRASGGTYGITTSAAVATTGALRMSYSTRTTGGSVTGGTSGANQFIDATTGAITMNLTATTTTGHTFFFKKTDNSANTVTVNAQAGGTIDGVQTYILTSQNDFVEIMSTAVSGEWRVINQNSNMTKAAVGLGNVDNTSNVTERATTRTLTNARITPRTGTTASSATPTPNADTHDFYTVTALAAGATFGAPTGTPTDGQELTLRIKDNATAQTLAFNAIYRFSSDLAAPTTTTISKTLYMKFKYNGADTKWDCLAWMNNF